MDDVDRLFARLEPIEPPADLLARVTAATAAVPARSAQRRLWLALDAVAIVALALVSLWLGMELQETGALDLLGLMLIDAGAMREGLGALLEALLQALPWPQLALLGANLVAVAALSELALRGDRRPTRLGA